MMAVERRHEGSAADRPTALGWLAGRGTGGRLGIGRFLRTADRRVGAAAGQELHQLLQAALVRSPLTQAAASTGPSLGKEARRAARAPPTRPPLGPARGSQPGLRMQAA